MTSFDVFESSVESSRPIEIYTIAVGAVSYRFTSHSSAITIGVNTWNPIPISRASISQGVEERRRTLSIDLPADSSFAQQYLSVPPGQKATVSIIRLQRDESPTFNTQVLIFKGNVASVRFSDDGIYATIVARSIESAQNRTIPRFTFMGLCNHVLFDNGCKVNSALFSQTGMVTAVSGNVITVAGANSRPDGYWTGGWCKPVGVSDFRLILSHTGNDLRLLLPFSSSVSGADVQIFAGCDHTLTGHCATKFDNVLEFGGFPFVPSKNPFESGLD